MKRKYIIIILSFLTFVSCNINPLKRIKLEAGTRLYFYNLDNGTDISTNNNPLTNFYIEDIQIIKKFNEELSFKKIDEFKHSEYYQVQLVNANKVLFSALYDKNSNLLIFGNKAAKVNIDTIDWFVQKKEETEIYSIKLNTIKQARKLYIKLDKEKVYMPIFLLSDNTNPLFFYNYETILSYEIDKTSLSFKETFSKNKKILEDAKLTIISAHYSDSTGVMSLNVYSPHKNIERIPSIFKIEQDFTEIKETELIVIGIQRLELIEIINSLGIKDYKISLS